VYSTLEEAIQELKRHPGTPVLVEVDGLLVVMRVQAGRTADDIFSEIGSWEGESEEELVAMLASQD
jgi:hypothetical protein